VWDDERIPFLVDSSTLGEIVRAQQPADHVVEFRNVQHGDERNVGCDDLSRCEVDEIVRQSPVWAKCSCAFSLICCARRTEGLTGI
jgi:hypothetical protein